MAGNLDIERRNDFRGSRCFIREVAGVLEQLAGDGNAGFQSLGRPEGFHQPVLQGDFLDLIDDGVRLLQRHLKMAIFLQVAPGSLPPFLPIIPDHLRHQHLLDLVHSGLAAEAIKHHAH